MVYTTYFKHEPLMHELHEILETKFWLKSLYRIDYFISNVCFGFLMAMLLFLFYYGNPSNEAKVVKYA